MKSKFHNVDVWSLQFDLEEVKKRNNGSGGVGSKDEYSSSNGGDVGSLNEGKEDDTVASDDEDTCGIVMEIDGVPLEEVKLPLGWKAMKHHYRYDPNYKE